MRLLTKVGRYVLSVTRRLVCGPKSWRELARGASHAHGMAASTASVYLLLMESQRGPHGWDLVGLLCSSAGLPILYKLAKQCPRRQLSANDERVSPRRSNSWVSFSPCVQKQRNSAHRIRAPLSCALPPRSRRPCERSVTCLHVSRLCCRIE